MFCLRHVYLVMVAGLLAMGAFGGCATPPPVACKVGSGTSGVHAECLVCKKNADLACVDVEVDGKTPSADFLGKRYYFCSDECRKEFVKNPGKFVAEK